jgi:hypothetical protein
LHGILHPEANREYASVTIGINLCRQAETHRRGPVPPDLRSSPVFAAAWPKRFLAAAGS